MLTNSTFEPIRSRLKLCPPADGLYPLPLEIIMMKKVNALLALLAITFSLHGQITVTNATFPAAGDTLRTATDNAPENIVISNPGGPYIWDFTGLTADARQETVFRPASEGTAAASYPTADLVTFGAGGGENYFDVTTTNFDLLGFSGMDPTGTLPIATDFKFTPPIPERRAPLTFIASHTSSSSLALAFSLADLPAEILDSLGIPSGLLDSIRIRVVTGRNDLVDAYGTVMIPGGTYDVLREKRIESTNTRIEVHALFLGWQDITDIVPIPGFGQDTTTSYYFISNTAKEPIAVINTDSTGTVATDVEFKDNGAPSASRDIRNPQYTLTLSPNPASDFTMLDLSALPAGTYTLQLFTITGKNIRNQTVDAAPTRIELQSMPVGSYWYRVSDAQHRTLSTGALIRN